MKVNPLVVLLFNLILPLCAMFPGNPYQHIFFLSFSSLMLLLAGKWERFLKFVLFYGGIVLAVHLLGYVPGGIGSFWGMFLAVMLQFIPCFAMASILILDYGPAELISALAPLPLPKSFVVALAVVVRYIPTFKKEFGFIREAMRLRGVPYSLKKPLRSFEFFLVPQLFRCAILADEITAAGLTKGITNPVKRTSYRDMRLRLSDTFFCVILLAGMGVFVLWR